MHERRAGIFARNVLYYLTTYARVPRGHVPMKEWACHLTCRALFVSYPRRADQTPRRDARSSRSPPVEPHMLNDDTEVRHATGTVLWFDFAKGHGFVMCDAGGPDCLLHQSSLCAQAERRIEESSRVAFDIVDGIVVPRSSMLR